MTLKETTRKRFLTGVTAVIILLLVFSYYCPLSQGQMSHTFTTSDKFAIPNLKGTIGFAVNGSYSEATLNNDAWTFTNLTLNKQSIPGFGLNDFSSVGNLTFSTQDSNVTILAYVTINDSFSVSLLSYTVEGKGKQMINFDLSSSGPAEPAEWSLIIPKNVVLAEGQGWTLLPDSTLIVTSEASNLTVVHFDLILPDKSNLPFYIQHSVTLATAAVMAIVATLALIVRAKTVKRKKS